LRKEIFKPVVDFSRAPRRLNILNGDYLRNKDIETKKRTHSGAAVGLKHAFAERVKPILSAKWAVFVRSCHLRDMSRPAQTLVLLFAGVGKFHQ
jgi:hypothetical protein